MNATTTLAAPADTTNGRLPSPAGVYVHYPYCARKCPYCDFYTFGAEHPAYAGRGGYIAALLREIRGGTRRAGTTDPVPGEATAPLIDTVYFGGGTPSLLPPTELAGILAALRERFEFASDTEITLEVNPTAAEAARLAPARELGVNRLSIGCQSFQDRFLGLLGRDHDAAAARAVPRIAREAGFDNISVDLMFGLPGQTAADLTRDLDEALALEPAHLSAYGLTLHDGTPFKRWHEEGRLVTPGEDVELEQFGLLMDDLARSGFEHYEISNWARPGRRSRHNSKYWRRADVHAFGVSAHGVLGGRRTENPRDLRAYLAGDLPAALPAVSTNEDGIARSAEARYRSALGEIMMLAIRRTDGVEWAEIEDWARAWITPPSDPSPDGRASSASVRDYYQAELGELFSRGWIHDPGPSLRLTRQGIFMADAAAEMFL